MKLVTLFLILFSVQNSFAITEDTDYQANMASVVLPYFVANSEISSFTAKDGVTIKYAKLLKKNAVANIVISNGRTESYIKYAELVYDLKDLPVNLFLIDHRGQGFSSRLIDDPQKGYVKDFNDYVEDLNTLAKTELVLKSKTLKNYLVAHSMGGGIGTRYLELYPEVFTKALFSAPMFDIQTSPYPRAVAYALVNLLNTVGKGKDYAPGKGPYKPENDTFEKNTVTHSLLRFNWNKSLLSLYPEILLADPTNAWVQNALKASDTILVNAKKIQAQVTIMQATDETYVQNSAMERVCKIAPKCKIVKMEGGRHELFMEQDVLRNRAVQLIKDLLKKGN